MHLFKSGCVKILQRISSFVIWSEGWGRHFGTARILPSFLT